MSKKRLIKNKPTPGDLGIYTFKDNNPNTDYSNSDSVALRYDKFSKQDLYSTSIGDSLNEAICDSKIQNAIHGDYDPDTDTGISNLKFTGGSFIEINSLNIKNRNVNSDINDTYFRIYICSSLFFSPYKENGGIKTYTEMLNSSTGFKRKVDNKEVAKFFSQSGPDYNEDGAPGRGLFSGIRIAEVFDKRNVFTEGESGIVNLDQIEAAYIPNFHPSKYDGFDPKRSMLKFEYLDNTLSTPENPYIDASDETTLFQEGGDVPNPIYIILHMDGDMDTTYDKSRNETISIWSFTPEELFNENGSGKVTQLDWDNHDIQVYSIDQDYTAAFTGEALSITINTLGGIEEDSDTYKPQDIYKSLNPSVTPPTPLYNQSQIDSLILQTFPSSEILSTNNLDIGNISDEFSFKYTDIYADYLPIPYVELLSSEIKDFQIYYEDIDDRILVSAPNVVNLSFDVTIHPEPEITDGGYTLFVNEDDDNIELFSKFTAEEYEMRDTTMDYWNNRYILNSNNSDYMFFVVDWNDVDNNYKTIYDVLIDWPRTSDELLKKRKENLYNIQHISNTTQTGLRNTLNHSYNTSGMKRIKTIMISHNTFMDKNGIFNEGIEPIRWKLITTKIFLDIPSNEFPDFGQVGGADYTTIPWPYTTPIIGGVSENSKYSNSIDGILGGGKIGDLDIIDETFLVNAKENDELGKAIEKMDLEQVRFFNASYDMNTLLDIPISNTIITNIQPELLEELKFPLWLEEFDLDGDGIVESDLDDMIKWADNHGRPDISDWIVRNTNGNPLDESDYELPLNQPWPPLPYPVVNTIMMGSQDELMSPMIPTYPIVNTIISQEESNQIQGGPFTGPSSAPMENENWINPDPEYSYYGWGNWTPGGNSCWEWTNVGGDSVDVYQWIYICGDNDDGDDDDTQPPPPPVSYTCYDESALNYNSGGDYACGNNYCCIYLDDLVDEWITYFSGIQQYDWNTFSTTVNDEGLTGLQQLQQFFIDDFTTPGYVIINWAIETFFVSTDDDGDDGGDPDDTDEGTGNFVIINDGCDIPTDNGESFIFVLKDGRVLFNHKQNDSIQGFQFDIPNNYFITDASGGEAGNNNFQIQYNENTVVAYSYYNKITGGSCGTLLNLTLYDSDSGLPVDWNDEPVVDELHSIIFSDSLSNEIDVDYFTWRTGCTDEWANNYWESATWNDGSCTYDPLRDLEDFYNVETLEWYYYLNPYTDTNHWDGETTERTFSEESSVGQIFIDDNSDNVLKESCKLELNLGSISDKAITDSGGNSNKGLLIGDYKIRKTQKNQPMRRDSYIKLPQKGKENGAL